MRSFICALVIAALIIAFIFINSAVIGEKLDCIYSYVSSAADEIKAGAETDGVRGKIETAYSLWDGTVGLLSFTTGYGDIDRADDAVNDAYSYCFLCDADECLCALNRAADALSRLKKLASFSFDSIF